MSDKNTMSSKRKQGKGMRFHCLVLKVLLFHPFIESIRTVEVWYGASSASICMEASLGSGFTKGKAGIAFFKEEHVFYMANVPYRQASYQQSL